MSENDEGNETQESNQLKKKNSQDLKVHPTQFAVDMKENQNGKKVKAIPVGGKGTIKFETDAEDEFFVRPNEQGEIELEIINFQENNSSGGGNMENLKRLMMYSM